MRKLDRYVIREMIGPFLFGIGAFVIVLVSIDLLYDALKLIVRQGYPADAVAKAFLYQIPQTIALTLPMATMFSSLMAIGRLSGDGEITAMRAGGVGFVRIVAIVIIAGLVVTGVAFAFNEGIVPHANAASRRLLQEMSGQVVADQDYLYFQIPAQGRPQRIVYAKHFDADSKQLENVWIAEFHGETFQEMWEAEKAVWQQQTITLNQGTHTTQTAMGPREEKFTQAHCNVGLAPWEAAQIRKEPEDMTLPQLRERIASYQQIAAPARPHTQLTILYEHYHIRLAAPWCALGFALIGVSLGQRPQRTSTGVGLGVSLTIILAYYIIFNILRVIGEQGTLSPVIAAWLPNAILFIVGGGLLIEAAR